MVEGGAADGDEIGGWFWGAVVHAGRHATAVTNRKQRAKRMSMIAGAGEGVLFTNRGLDSPAPKGDGGPADVAYPCVTIREGEHNLAKPNFGYQKRQKELEKKRKKEEKLKKKMEKNAPPAPDTDVPSDSDTSAPDSAAISPVDTLLPRA